ncbi:MAG: GNAT family N-acetyltransferase [Sphaerochaeta sp.]|jgi:hypothetical protein
MIKKSRVTHNDKKIFTQSIDLLKKRFNKDFFRKVFSDINSNIADILINILFKKTIDYGYKHKKIEDVESIYNNIISCYYIDCTKTVPYIGGYSDSCNILYVDKDSLSSFNEFQFKLIVIHEYIEKNLLKFLKDFDYAHAHQIAQQIEYAFYNKDEEDFIQKTIDKIETPLLKKFHSKKVIIPLDLDKTPYIPFNEIKLLTECKEYTISQTTIKYEYATNEKDLEQIFNVEKAMFKNGKYFQSTIDFYKRALRKNSHKFFVAKTNFNEIVGVACFIVSKRGVRLYSLAVLKGFQPFKIGKNLVNELHNIADYKALLRNHSKKGFIYYKKLQEN